MEAPKAFPSPNRKKKNGMKSFKKKILSPFLGEKVVFFFISQGGDFAQTGTPKIP